MSGTILIWEWGAGLGHVAKLAGLGRAIARRSQGRIHYVAKSLHPEMPAEVAERTLMAPRIESAVERIGRPSTLADMLHNGGFGSIETLIHAIGAWRDLYDLLKPRIVVCEFAPFALLAAQGLSMPVVQFGTGWHIPPPGSVIPPYRHEPPDDEQGFVLLQERLLDNINAALEAHELGSLPRLSALFERADHTVLTTVAELDHFDRTEGVAYLGALETGLGRRREVAWPASRHDGILAYLKPFPGLRPLLHALADSDRPVIVHAAGKAHDTARHFANHQLQVHRDPVSVPADRPPALVISHGGHGLVQETLLAGIPMLLLPQHQEQRINAANAVAIGGAISLDGRESRIGQSGFTARIEELIAGSACSCAARRFARRYRSHDPVEQTDRLAADIMRL